MHWHISTTWWGSTSNNHWIQHCCVFFCVFLNHNTDDLDFMSAGQSDPNSLQTDSSSESEADVVTDGCGSPRMQRRRRQKVFRAEKVDRSITFRTLDELLYNDNLPEVTLTAVVWIVGWLLGRLDGLLVGCWSWGKVGMVTGSVGFIGLQIFEWPMPEVN